MGTITACVTICLFSGACLAASEAKGLRQRAFIVAVVFSFGVACIRTVMMSVEKAGW